MSNTRFMDRVHRSDIPPLHQGRRDFLAVGGVERAICQVLQSRIVEEGRARQYWPTDGDPWRNFPWLTPILGSGTLGLPDSILSGAGTLPTRVRDYWAEPPSEELQNDRDSAWERRIRARLESDDDRQWILDRLEDYTRALLVDKLGESVYRDDAAEQAVADPDITPVAMLMLLTGSQVTCLFHEMSQQSARLVSRRDSGRARLVWDEELPALQRCNHLLRIAVAHLRALERASSGQVQATIRATVGLLESVRDGLDEAEGASLTARHVKTLSDLAWHFLVRPGDGRIPTGSTHAAPAARYPYPGWSDLLMELTLSSGGPDGHTHPGGMALKQLTEAIVGVIEPAAKSSWLAEAVPDADLSEAQLFHNAIADVIVAQAQVAAHFAEVKEHLRQGVRVAEAAIKEATDPAERDRLVRHRKDLNNRQIKGVPEVPKAVVLLTTFDMELEAALCRVLNKYEGADRTGLCAQVSSRISMIMPVYFRADRNSHFAELVWLEAVCEVDPSGRSSLSDFVKPAEWRVMSANRSDLPTHPIAVHLAGAPLVRLPRLSDYPELCAELWKVGVGGSTGVGDASEAEPWAVVAGGELLHSVTVDEYLALRQSEMERHWVTAAASGSGDNGSDWIARNRSFAEQLLRTPSPGPLRYWVALGVPVMDPAVRHRVYSHLTSRRFSSDGGPRRGSEQQLPESVTEKAQVETSMKVEAEPETKDVYGLAVNLRIDPDEVLLLSTLDIDVVLDRCETFTSDFHHYAAHVRATGEGARPTINGCSLPETPGVQ